MIVLKDLDATWDGLIFEDKAELKEFLQSEDAENMNLTLKEYQKENGHVSLNELCDLFGVEYEDSAIISNIDIIDDVISGLFDDCEQEQEHAQKIINAWITIKEELNK
jgi:hypothetical protein